jgi:hypothetical protein
LQVFDEVDTTWLESRVKQRGKGVENLVVYVAAIVLLTRKVASKVGKQQQQQCNNSLSL